MLQVPVSRSSEICWVARGPAAYACCPCFSPDFFSNSIFQTGNPPKPGNINQSMSSMFTKKDPAVRTWSLPGKIDYTIQYDNPTNWSPGQRDATNAIKYVSKASNVETKSIPQLPQPSFNAFRSASVSALRLVARTRFACCGALP